MGESTKYIQMKKMKGAKMERRNFLEQTTAPTNSQGERTADQWHQCGTGTMGLPNRKKTLQYDVAVVGGGMAPNGQTI
jgi:hypothetical protein